MVATSLHSRVEVYEDRTADDWGASTCGRGLRCRGACDSGPSSVLPAGTRLYEEEPLVVTPTGVKSTHRARWRAYMWLVACAGESDQDAASLASFNGLTTGDAASQEQVHRCCQKSHCYVVTGSRPAIPHPATPL